MGILEFISNEHAGIIPRAISQIFQYANQQYHHHHELDEPIVVSLSFLQLYRETIQDLLAPVLNNNNNINSNINNNNSNYGNSSLNSSYTSLHTIYTNITNNNNNINGSSVTDENLLIREDPFRGFYVEGLQEFIVRNYNEAGIFK